MLVSIDLRKQSEVVGLMSQFVEEEKRLNPYYGGMFINGSVSRAEANNGSDIDGVHVIRGSVLAKPDYEYAWPIQFRLRSVFELCYGIPIQDNRHVIKVSDMNSVKRGTDEFDKHTIAAGVDGGIVEQIDQETGFKHREKYSSQRMFKSMSVESGVHPYRFPKGGVFPWWTEYGLLEGGMKKRIW